MLRRNQLEARRRLKRYLREALEYVRLEVQDRKEEERR